MVRSGRGSSTIAQPLQQLAGRACAQSGRTPPLPRPAGSTRFFGSRPSVRRREVSAPPPPFQTTVLVASASVAAPRSRPCRQGRLPAICSILGLNRPRTDTAPGKGPPSSPQPHAASISLYRLFFMLRSPFNLRANSSSDW